MEIISLGRDLAPDQCRADAARYQEVRCKSALNPVKGMPFEWTLNPYRGCTHGCHYCYARRYQTQFELGSGDEFASIIFVSSSPAGPTNGAPTWSSSSPGWASSALPLAVP